MGEEQYYIPVNPPAERKFESAEEERDFYKNKCEFYKSEYCGLIDEIENKSKKKKKTKKIAIISVFVLVVLILFIFLGIQLKSDKFKNDFNNLISSLQANIGISYDNTEDMYKNILYRERLIKAFEFNQKNIPNDYQDKIDSINDDLEYLKSLYEEKSIGAMEMFEYKYWEFVRFILSLE